MEIIFYSINGNYILFHVVVKNKLNLLKRTVKNKTYVPYVYKFIFVLRTIELIQTKVTL